MPTPGPSVPKGLAMTSLITGIVGLLLGWVPIVGLVIRASRCSRNGHRSVTEISAKRPEDNRDHHRRSWDVCYRLFSPSPWGSSSALRRRRAPETEATSSPTATADDTESPSESPTASESPSPTESEETSSAPETTATTPSATSQEPTPEAPEETQDGSVSQRNALGSAENYLSFSAFSR